MVKSKNSIDKKTQSVKTKPKSRSKSLKTNSKPQARLLTHKSKLTLAVIFGLILFTAYLSVNLFRPAAAETAQVSWTAGDPAFSVDVDQTKSPPVPCNTESVYLGNDTEFAASVCVVKRATWRYGAYSRYVCGSPNNCGQERGYAIGYGDDTKMYRMRNMPEFLAPYLVPGSNTMVVRDSNQNHYSLGVIKDFQLQFNEIVGPDGSKEYAYNGSQYFKFSTPSGERMKVQAVGASSTGRWLVAEAPDVGLFRINLETLEAKRFSNLVYNYGTGSSPSMQFAVSNDGASVAAMGSNTSFVTYSVTETCGDGLTDTMTKATPVASPCTQKEMAGYMANNVAGFTFGTSPSFDENAGILNLQAHYSAEGITAAKWVTLAFATAPDAGDGNCLMTEGTATTTASKCCVTNRSYPQIIRQMMGKQAERMKVTCSGTDGSSTTGNTEAWAAWQKECLNLETTVQQACKGISYDEFIQMYKGGILKNASSVR